MGYESQESRCCSFRPLNFSRSQRYLFVNVDASHPGAQLRVGMFDSDSGLQLRSLTNAVAITSNATRMLVSWGLHGSELPSASSAVRFEFELRGGCLLYSFWVSETIQGRSGGWVGRGGPEFHSLRDV